jgi:hypothetical protein
MKSEQAVLPNPCLEEEEEEEEEGEEEEELHSSDLETKSFSLTTARLWKVL